MFILIYVSAIPPFLPPYRYSYRYRYRYSSSIISILFYSYYKSHNLQK